MRQGWAEAHDCASRRPGDGPSPWIGFAAQGRCGPSRGVLSSRSILGEMFGAGRVAHCARPPSAAGGRLSLCFAQRLRGVRRRDTSCGEMFGTRRRAHHAQDDTSADSENLRQADAGVCASCCGGGAPEARRFQSILATRMRWRGTHKVARLRGRPHSLLRVTIQSSLHWVTGTVVSRSSR